jgi:hypothetical protein
VLTFTSVLEAVESVGSDHYVIDRRLADLESAKKIVAE